MSMWGDGGHYGAWADYLERWTESGQRPSERPPALDRGDFDSATWARLMLRIQDALNTKLQRWSDALVRHMGEARDEFTWGRALSQAREGLRSIIGLGLLPELPEEIRDQLRKQIEGTISSTQQTLEDDAQRDLRGPYANDAEIRLRQLHANPLNTAISTANTIGSATEPLIPPPGLPGGGRRRQIIIDRTGN
jgi:hypothetical protein